MIKIAFSNIRSPWLPWAMMALLIVVLGTVTWQWGKGSDLLPCYKDCGETFISLHQAKNFEIYGFKYGLLEDHATSNDPGAHPALYTHNVNIGNLFYTFLEAIGVEGYTGKQTATFVVYLLTLVYGVFAVWRISGSRVLAAIFLLFFATDFEQVIAFSFNSLRAWSWLPLFGLSVHIVSLAREGEKRTALHWALVFLFATIAFGIGYSFLVINFFLAFFLLVAFGRFQPKSLLKKTALLITIFAVPVILRQIQVMMVLGPSFWAKDFLTSAAIKVPYLAKLLSIPPIEEIDQYYRSLGIVRPPAVPSSSFADIVNLAYTTLRLVVLPANGLATFIVLAGSIVLSFALVNHGGKSFWMEDKAAPDFSQAARWLLVLCLSVGVGLTFFMPFSLHVYLKHQFPLIALPINLGKAIVITWLVALFVAQQRHKVLKYASILVAVGIVGDHLAINRHNMKQDSAIATGWVKNVLDNTESSYAVSWIPNTAASFANGWVVGVQPGRERDIAARLAAKEKPFEYDDYFLFYQRNAASGRGDYLKPDFWLYFPIDRVFNFDSPNPTCRLDYLTGLLLDAIGIVRSRPFAESPWVVPNHVGPGSTVRMGAEVYLKPGTTAVMEVLEPAISVEAMSAKDAIDRFFPTAERPPIARMSYNCRYQGASADIPWQQRWARPDSAYYVYFPIRVTVPSGRRSLVQVVALQVRYNAPVNSKPPAPIRRQQPTPDDLARIIPNTPVHYKGDGYIIFDLRDVIE